MIRKLRIILSIMTFCFCALGFFACNPFSSTPDGGTDVTFDLPINEYELEVGMTNKLDVSYDGEDTVVYNSFDTDIVTVSSEGVITGISKGETFVTVTAGELKAACKITVTQTEYSIALGGANINLVVGSKKNFNAVLYKNGRAYEGEVEWSVDDADNCGFVYNGNIATFTAEQLGVFTITATSDNASTQCRIKVVSADAKRLNTPVLTAESCNILKWTEIEGAEGYAVLVDNEWVETENTSFSFKEQVSDLRFGELLTVSVKVLSKDNAQYLDSLLSSVSLAHTYSIEELSEVTCTKKGSVRYTCEICEETYVVDNYKKEHTYADQRCSVCQTLRSPDVIYLYDDNYIPMPTNEEAAVTITEENENDTTLWKVKYRTYWENELTGGSVRDARMLWSAVYNNRNEIPEEERQGCYYVAGLSAETEDIYVTSMYNDGIHGDGEVKYVKKDAFKDKTSLKKVVLPETVTELRGAVFFGDISLETVIMPGVTYMPAIDHLAYGHNNFNDCYNLKAVVVGDGWIHYGRNFMQQTPGLKPDGYVPQVDIYVYGETEANIYANPGYVALNQNLSGNVYYYDETASLCDTWNFTADGEIEARYHHFVSKQCVNCSAMESDGVAYAYDSEKDCYFVANNANLDKSVVSVYAEYNDGTNGQKTVTYVADSAFQGNTKIVKVILPESVTSVGMNAFLGCSKLEMVVMPGVMKTTGINVFYKCTALTTVVVNPNATFSRKTFFSDCAKNEYAVQVNLYIAGTENKITYWNWGSNTQDANSEDMLTGNVYFYSETLASCGTWKYGEDGVTINKSAKIEHEYANGACTDCGAEQTAGVAYTYGTIKDSSGTEIATGYIVTGYTGSAKEVFIRSTYNDGVNGEKAIVAIGNAAFKNTSITKLIAPKSVMVVGGYAFQNCTKLKYVALPGWTKLDRYATIGETTVGNNQFLNCIALTKLILGESFTTNAQAFVVQASYTYSEKILNIYLSSSGGTYSSWSTDNMWTGNVYYYSEKQPTDTDKTYWHYVDGIATLWQ